jgi:hypothetical protein
LSTFAKACPGFSRFNLCFAKEALELFFETADPTEIKARLHDDVFVTRVEVAVG